MYPAAETGVPSAASLGEVPAEDTSTIVYVSLDPGPIDSLLVSDETLVRRGDTLAFRQNDPYRTVREDLAQLRTGRQSIGDALASIASFEPDAGRLAEVKAFLEALAARATERGTTDPSVEEAVDQDLLAAEIMGAEDALADYQKDLQKTGGAGAPVDSQRIAGLRAAIIERISFLQRARARMAAARQSSAPSRRRKRTLSPAQRAQLRDYEDALAPDTTYVFATETGIFRRGEPRTGSTPPPSVPAEDSIVHSGGYWLQPRSQPRLWATAQRVDTLANHSAKGLRILPD